jgi:hypothetical protein
MRNFLAAALVLIWAGCSTAPEVIKPLIEPQFGMTKQQMLDSMGKPDSIELYKKPDDSRFEFDIYVRQYGTGPYKLPICLVKDRVVGWGKSYYEDHISPTDTRIK